MRFKQFIFEIKQMTVSEFKDKIVAMFGVESLKNHVITRDGTSPGQTRFNVKCLKNDRSSMLLRNFKSRHTHFCKWCDIKPKKVKRHNPPTLIKDPDAIPPSEKLIGVYTTKGKRSKIAINRPTSKIRRI